jgi:CheY-like chemotaxis protein
MNTPLNVLLADDDTDDRFLFDKALMEIPIATHLTTVHDGEQLMDYLSDNSENLPHILFLDLNMPRKTGFECLCEISENEKLKDLSVVIFSTSYPQDKSYELGMINNLFKLGARVYIRKPGDFEQLKKTIQHALPMASEEIFSNGQLKYILNA